MVPILLTGRALRLLGTFIPIYLSYFAPWAIAKLRGRAPAYERWGRKHRRNAERFYRTAVRLRGGMIKIGQILSTRVDILPTEWVEVLERLQDKVDPQPWALVKRRLRAELGDDPERYFARIETTAVAAASFGQVHRAWTHEGDALALKVQYAGVEARLACDLWIGRLSVPLFNVFAPKLRLKGVYDEVAEALRTELDYRREADYGRRVRANLQGLTDVTVPEVVDAHTTARVIATRFFEGGRKVTDPAAYEGDEAASRHGVIHKLMEAFAHMFFVDGVFQSDPHPGNLLVRVRGGREELCILDFGQSKVLPDGFLPKLVQSAVAFMGRDVDGFCRSVVAMGMMSEEDVEHAKPIFQTFFDEMFDMTPDELKAMDVSGLKARIMASLDAIEGIHIPQDLVLYGRAFSILSGVVYTIDPKVNGFTLARPAIMGALAKSPSLFAAAAGASAGAAA